MKRNRKQLPALEDQYMGDRIREARIANGMTQKALAELIGVSYQQLQKYESGRDRIKAARIQLLMSALNRPFNYFFQTATDIRASTDVELVSVLTSKPGQRAVRAFSRLTPADQRLVIEVIERLVQEQANG